MSAIPDNYPQLLAEIATAVSAKLFELLPEQLDAVRCEQVGFQVAEHLRKSLGGIPLYVPKGEAYDLSNRDWEIYAKHNGRNLAVLAREYNLSEMRIRQIVAACQVVEAERRQTKIPGL